jgi:hypothetical protein
MKFLMQSTDDPETLRKPPTPETMAAIGAFMVEAEQSGAIFLTGGIQPPECGVRVTFEGGTRTVTDGPYAEAKEFLAGYWIVDCDSTERAYEIAARASAAPGKAGVPMNMPIEVRQVMSAPPADL